MKIPSLSTVVPRSALVMCLLLSACSDDKGAPVAQANAQAPTRAYVAIARGKIDIEGGLLDIAVPARGTVATVSVKEGDRVKKGQLLVQLSSQAADIDVGLAQAQLQRAQAAQHAEEQRLPAARQLAQRLQQAAQAGASDAARADDALQTQHQIESAAALARADVAIEREQLAHARQQASLLTVKAPGDAQIIGVHLQVGSTVQPQAQPMLVLLPDRPLVVRAELNESFVARVLPGMRADVVIESDPHAAPLAAHLVRIGQVYGPSRLYDDTQTRTNVRVVECILEFEQAPALRIGQNVRVSFHD
jgi:multidrug resistance efflux pump